jgi:hypothetical protein
MGLAERKKITEFYHELVFAKIQGKISQAELVKRLNAGCPSLHQREVDRKSAAAGEREL